jgi:hypothetical protein
MPIAENISLQALHTFGCNEKAQYFNTIQSIEDIATHIQWAKEKKLPYLILGAGSNLLVDLSVAIFVAAAAYLLWVRPKLILRETDLVVVNPFQRTLVNYADITELRTKWALQIDYADKSVQVWVAPANGKGRWISESTLRWKSDRVPLSDTRIVEHTSMSQSTRSDSGLAASLIRERMKH